MVLIAAPAHRAANRRTGRGAAAASQRQGKTPGAQKNRDQHRQDRQRRIIGNGKAGAEGQHGDKMGAPDAGAGDKTGGGQPGVTGPLLRRPRPRQKADRSDAGKQAKPPGKHDKAQIVLLGNTTQYIEHLATMSRKP